MSTVKKFSNNVIYQLLGYAIGALATLFLTPIILKNVDYNLYGIYVLSCSIVGYFSIVEFGLPAALIKYIAEFYTAKKWRDMNRYLNFSCLFFFLAGLLAFAGILVFSFFYEHFFAVPPALVFWGRVFIWIEAIELLFTLWVTPFRSLIDGMQFVYIRKWIDIVLNLVKFPLVFLVFKFISFKYAFFIYVLLNLIILMLVSSVLYAVFIKKYFTAFRFKFFYYDKDVFHKLFHFSVYVFLTNIAGMLIFNTDTMVVGFFKGAALVTIYSVGAGIAQNIRLLSQLINWPVYLMIAGVIGEKDPAKEELLLFRGTRIVSVLLSTGILLLIVFFPLFIRVWVGPDFERSIIVGQILLWAWFISSHYLVIGNFLVAKGIVRERFYLVMAEALLNLGLSIFFIKVMNLGLAGVALGTLIPRNLLGLQVYILNKHSKFHWVKYFTDSIFVNFIYYALVWITATFVLRYVGNIKLIGLLAVLGVLYLALQGVYYLIFCDAKDKEMIWRIIKRH